MLQRIDRGAQAVQTRRVRTRNGLIRGVYAREIRAPLLVLCAGVACSSPSPEPIGTQSASWFNTCHDEFIDPDVGNCRNLDHFTCKDGTDEFMWLPALGSDWLGTECQTGYYYTCIVNDKNMADVRCDK